MYPRSPLDIKKIIVVLHTLSAYNSFLAHYKVYVSDPRNDCVQDESMVKPKIL